jgi:hypothetical protein
MYSHRHSPANPVKSRQEIGETEHLLRCNPDSIRPLLSDYALPLQCARSNGPLRVARSGRAILFVHAITGTPVSCSPSHRVLFLFYFVRSSFMSKEINRGKRNSMQIDRISPERSRLVVAQRPKLIKPGVFREKGGHLI